MSINLFTQMRVISIKGIVGAMVLIFLLLGTAYGDPSEPIRKAMNTPASVFDVFLLALHQNEKCPGEADFCMTNVYYEFDDNLIYMNYLLKKDSKTWKDFVSKSKTNREAYLSERFSYLANLIVEGNFSPIRFTRLRHGYKKEGFNEKEFKDEISKRTVVTVFAEADNKYYKAVRDHHGKINIEQISTTEGVLEMLK